MFLTFICLSLTSILSLFNPIHSFMLGRALLHKLIFQFLLFPSNYCLTKKEGNVVANTHKNIFMLNQ